MNYEHLGSTNAILCYKHQSWKNNTMLTLKLYLGQSDVNLVWWMHQPSPLSK